MKKPPEDGAVTIGLLPFVVLVEQIAASY